MFHSCSYFHTADIISTDIERTTVTICWTVPSVTQQQQYRVVYGVDPEELDQTSQIVTGDEDITLTNKQYCVSLSGLQRASLYHFRIVITFGEQTIMTELDTFRTLDDRKFNYYRGLSNSFPFCLHL